MHGVAGEIIDGEIQRLTLVSCSRKHAGMQFRAGDRRSFAFCRCSTDVLLCTAVAIGLLLLGLTTTRNRNSCSVLDGWGLGGSSGQEGCKLETALQRPGRYIVVTEYQSKFIT